MSTPSVFMCEKPMQARQLAPYFVEAFPSSAPQYFASLLPYSRIGFTYPRGLRWQDYPYVTAPKFKDNSPLSSVDSLSPCIWILYHYEGDSLTKTIIDGSSMVQLLKSATLYYCCDPDYSSAHAFHTLLSLHDINPDPITSFRILSLVPGDITTALREGKAFGENYRLEVSAGQVKRYFEYNYNLNALTLLSPVFAAVGVPDHLRYLSKYALQALFFLNQSSDVMTQGVLALRMTEWAGTGRYRDYSFEFLDGMGSCASRASIIDSLLERELATLNEPTIHRKASTIAVSKKGEQFLSLLHKDCYDPDLPFRLDKWMVEGLSSSQTAIDRYIRTFFGKQKRYWRKVRPS